MSFGFSSSPDSFREQNGYVIEGSWYPRVTSIVQIKAKPALYWFYGQAASYEAANEAKNKSARDGTEAHRMVEAMIRNEPYQVKEGHEGFADAFRKFLKQHDFFPMKEFIERRIRSGAHRYAGTFDMLAEIDGKFGIVDIKTSASIYRDYSLQTAAYLDAVNNEPWVFSEEGQRLVLKRPVETRFIVRIGQKRLCERCGATLRIQGGREKKPYGGEASCDHIWGPLQGEQELNEFRLQENDFGAFLACKTLWEWENEAMLNKIGFL